MALAPDRGPPQDRAEDERHDDALDRDRQQAADDEVPGARRQADGERRERRSGPTGAATSQIERPIERVAASSDAEHDDRGRARVDELGSRSAGRASCRQPEAGREPDQRRGSRPSPAGPAGRGSAAWRGSRRGAPSTTAATTSLRERGADRDEERDRRERRSPGPTGRNAAANRPATRTSLSSAAYMRIASRGPGGLEQHALVDHRQLEVGVRVVDRLVAGLGDGDDRERAGGEQERRRVPGRARRRRRARRSRRGRWSRPRAPRRPAPGGAPARRASAIATSRLLPMPPNALPASSAERARTNRARARRPTTTSRSPQPSSGGARADDRHEERGDEDRGEDDRGRAPR